MNVVETPLADTSQAQADQMVRRVSEVAPVLRGQATRSGRQRRLSDPALEALAAAGVFRMRTPARYGGYECEARTLVEVAAALARADGSAGWTVSMHWIAAWIVGHFPDEVQDEVFTDPDAGVCVTVGPGDATAVPVDGGFLVNGRWPFITGAPHARWQEIRAMLITPDGAPRPLMAMVPLAQLEILDDWDTSGLRGTGSVTTVAEDVFVPAQRALPLDVLLRQDTASKLNADTPLYRAPIIAVTAASVVGTAVGMAQAAREVFFTRLPGRKITYTDYSSAAEAPLTHLRAAQACLKIDQAQFHARRVAGDVDDKCASAEPWSVADRARARADQGEAARLAKAAVDIFAAVSGGSSIRTEIPLGRIVQDIRAYTTHALFNPDTNTELYGRVLCGLPPNTPYL
jgi:alkylation response protein AidB-like acyl-CoA dehydrogenase